MVRIFDIRFMKKELEILAGFFFKNPAIFYFLLLFYMYGGLGHNGDVTSIGWHPHHESLLLSGGYNGSLVYWVIGTTQVHPFT